MEHALSDKSLSHRLFEIGIVVKGLHGLLEFAAAVALYIVSGAMIYHAITVFLFDELSEDPNDFLANFLLLHTHVTTHGKDFAALYLFISGIINIIIAIGLLLHRKNMFPVAKLILAAFVVYQAHLFVKTHSLWLVVFILYDLAIIALIYSEYRRRWPKESPSPAV